MHRCCRPHWFLLVALLAAGCSDDATVPEGERPIAVLDAPTTAEAGVEVVVDGRRSSDADGYITSFTFDWGDGSPLEISADGVATHVYRFGGTALVTLSVLDNRGNKSSVEAAIVVAGDAAPPQDGSGNPPTPEPSPDAGSTDAGATDAGSSDANTGDAGFTDGGSSDPDDGSGVPVPPPAPQPDP